MILTKSGYGGHCYNQTCQSGSWEDTADAWYSQNLQISIPVTVIVGLLVSSSTGNDHAHFRVRSSSSCSCWPVVSGEHATAKENLRLWLLDPKCDKVDMPTPCRLETAVWPTRPMLLPHPGPLQAMPPLLESLGLNRTLSHQHFKDRPRRATRLLWYIRIIHLRHNNIRKDTRLPRLRTMPHPANISDTLILLTEDSTSRTGIPDHRIHGTRVEDGLSGIEFRAGLIRMMEGQGERAEFTTTGRTGSIQKRTTGRIMARTRLTGDSVSAGLRLIIAWI